MKKFLLPIVVYLVICTVAILLPASEGYDGFGWKLIIAQVYAMPALLIVATATLSLTKKQQND